MKTPQLGDKVKDVVTGFAGTVTGRSEYLNGCVHYCVETRPKAGVESKHQWVDEQRLEVTQDGAALRVKFGLEPPKSKARVLTRTVKRARSGGPAIHAPRRH